MEVWKSYILSLLRSGFIFLNKLFLPKTETMTFLFIKRTYQQTFSCLKIQYSACSSVAVCSSVVTWYFTKNHRRGILKVQQVKTFFFKNASKTFPFTAILKLATRSYLRPALQKKKTPVIWNPNCSPCQHEQKRVPLRNILLCQTWLLPSAALQPS